MSSTTWFFILAVSPAANECVGGVRTVPWRHAETTFPRDAAHPSFYSAEQIRQATERARETEWGRRFRERIVRYAETSPVVTLPEHELARRVSEKVWFYLPRCPRCHGSYMDPYWHWHAEVPDRFSCQSCGTQFPNDAYPMDCTLDVVSPTGGTQAYRYYEDADGIRYFFDAKLRQYLLNSVTGSFAILGEAYALTGARRYARRAALVLHRLAHAYPHWPVHGPGESYGVPGPRGYTEKFFSADPPFPYVSGRYTNWYYRDLYLAGQAAMAYDLIYHSGALDELTRRIGHDVRVCIERDLLAEAAAFVLEFPADMGNPGGWNARNLAVVGRCLNDSGLVEEAARQFRYLIRNGFNADGLWHEATWTYHAMVLTGMLEAPDILRGGRDPGAATIRPTPTIDLYRSLPQLDRIYRCGRRLFLPNGYALAVNDTWPLDHVGKTAVYEERAYANYGGRYVPPSDSSYSVFRRPARSLTAGEPEASISRAESNLFFDTGFALLQTGAGADRMQVFFDFGRFAGHHHRDCLQFALFARGHDLSPDLGYTYTRARPWVDSTAAHNTVVVDGRGQSMAYGNLTAWFAPRVDHAAGPMVQFVEADAAPVYRRRGVKRYDRGLALVRVSDHDAYVLDMFRVEGGDVHDWLLHGSADFAQRLETNVALRPMAGTLLDGIPGGVRAETRESAYDAVRGLTEDGNDVQTALARVQSESGYDFITHLRRGAAEEPTELTFTFAEPRERPRWAYAFSSAAPRTPDLAIDPDPHARFRTTVFVSPGAELIVGDAPGVRRASERDDRLDASGMPIALVRREAAGASVFVALHVPAGRTPAVLGAEILARDESRGICAVRVRHAAGTDYLVASAEPARTVDVRTEGGPHLRFNGRFGFVRVAEAGVRAAALVEGTEISFGDFTLQQPQANLEATVTRTHEDGAAGCAIDLDRVWPVSSVTDGSVMLVLHADGSRSAYPLQGIAPRAGGTRVTLQGVPSLTLSEGEVAGVTAGTIRSTIAHPKAFYDAWYRGKHLHAGRLAFTIRAVRAGREFVVRETDRLRHVKPGMPLRVVATVPGDRVRVPLHRAYAAP